MLLWCDGFNWVTGSVGGQMPAGLGQKYMDNTVAIPGSNYLIGDGRDFGQSLRIPGSATIRTPSLGNISTVIFGFAFKLVSGQAATTTNPLFLLFDGGSNQAGLWINGSEQLAWYRGGTQLDVGSTVMTEGDWNFIEVKARIHNSLGTYELRINGDLEFSGSNVDTQGTGNASFDQILFAHGGPNRVVQFDDFYVLDDTGDVNNDFLGDVNVQEIFPVADGDDSDWTPSTGGDNYALVDETDSHDGDDTYLESVTHEQRNLFQYANLLGVGDIYGIQMNTFARVTDNSAFGLKHVIKSGASISTDFPGQEVDEETYTLFRRISEDDPQTTAPWTVANLNDAQFGIEVE